MTRTMGDMGWLNDYVGINYRWGGRDFDSGLDCYGLVKLVYEQEYCETLPDWLIDEIDLRGRVEQIAAVVTSGEWTAKEEPEDGDIVLSYRARHAHHMGLYYGGGVLHCIEGGGVVYETLARFQEANPHLAYGEWRP